MGCVTNCNGTRPLRNCDRLPLVNSEQQLQNELVNGYRNHADANDATLLSCVRSAFHSSFQHNDRVRVWATRVTLEDFTFIVVERTIAGLDDSVYRKNFKVWKHVPRGQACVFIVESSGDTFYQVAALQGLRKFAHFDTAYQFVREAPVTVVALEAIDGDCGQLTAFSVGEERFWLVGSKDRHLLVRYDVPEEDLISYFNNMNGAWCAELPTRVARVWRETLCALPHEKAAELHKYLSTSGYTACFDAILRDSGHLVDYGPGETLKFYAITHCEAPESHGLCVDPISSTKILQSFGLDVVLPLASVELASSEYVALRDNVGRRLNCRGAVIYGFNEAGIVIRMWKLRSQVYIVERATQEAIVTHRLCGETLRNKIAKKLSGLPREVRHSVVVWKETRFEHFLLFAAWLHITEQLTARTDHCGLQELRYRWITLQRHFLQQTAADANMRLQLTDYESSQGDIAINNADVILCVGPQGCGKSTFSRTLFALLQQAGHFPAWINQDEMGSKTRFLDAIRAAKNKNFTHIIIDKMNLDDKARKDYIRLGLEALTVVWSHPNGAKALAKICFDRVCRRGYGHRTFQIKKNEQGHARRILQSCVYRCRPPTEGPYMEVNVAEPTANIVARVWNVLSVHGLKELPQLSTLDLTGALRVANVYESFLRRFPRPVLYGAIQMASPDAILALVPPEMLIGKVVQETFHVTTIYVGGGGAHIDPVLVQQLVELLGKSIQLTLTRVVSDPKGTAIAVRNEAEFPCANAHPHITIANAKNVPAKYSNELLDDSHADDPCRTVFELPTGTCATGTFEFVFK